MKKNCRMQELLKMKSLLIGGWSGTVFGGRKRYAFTLAEVLITLGIIGVVAALTIPTLIKNYQKQVWVNQLKKTYSTLNEGFKQMVASEGCTTLRCADISDDWPITNLDFTKANTKEKFVSTFKLENVYVAGAPENSIYNYNIKFLSGDEENFRTFFIVNNRSGLVGTTPSGEIIAFANSIIGPIVAVDINGLKSPNVVGRDIFAFSDFDLKDTVMVTPFYSKQYVELLASNDAMTAIDEEERIQTVNDECSTTLGGFANLTCAEKIIMDGWKMTY